MTRGARSIQQGSFPTGSATAAGVLCGGVIGTLLDCHSGAALAQALEHAEGRWPWAESAGWATAAYRVEMLDAPARTAVVR